MQMHTQEIISVTDVQCQTKDIFAKLAEGTQDKFCVMRDNELAAVMLSAKRYEALLNELDDLRIEAIARERLASFDPTRALSHETMLALFHEDA